MKLRSSLASLSIFALMAILGAGAAQAGASAALVVTAVVAPSCEVSAQPLTFVGAQSRSASVDSESSIRLRCSPDLAYTVRLNGGLNASGGQRRMIGGTTGKFLNYTIYEDAARTRPWEPSGKSGTAPRNGEDILLPTYGRINQLTATPDAYADTITVSLEF